MESKIIVISGGSSGLGYAYAKVLSEKNKVIILARNEENLKKVSGELGCEFEVCDITNKDEVVDRLGKIGKKYDKIDGDYKYLVKMPMDSVTEENVANIMAEKATTEGDIETLRKTSVETIWYRELTKLSTEYDKYKLIREKIQMGSGEKKKVVKKVKITKKK